MVLVLETRAMAITILTMALDETLVGVEVLVVVMEEEVEVLLMILQADLLMEVILEVEGEALDLLFLLVITVTLVLEVVEGALLAHRVLQEVLLEVLDWLVGVLHSLQDPAGGS